MYSLNKFIRIANSQIRQDEFDENQKLYPENPFNRLKEVEKMKDDMSLIIGEAGYCEKCKGHYGNIKLHNYIRHSNDKIELKPAERVPVSPAHKSRGNIHSKFD
jgi:hypothetical protein